MRRLDVRSDDTRCVYTVRMDNLKRDITREALVLRLKDALERKDEAKKNLIEAVRTAHDNGVTYREMSAVTPASHEYFRLLLKDGR